MLLLLLNPNSIGGGGGQIDHATQNLESVRVCTIINTASITQISLFDTALVKTNKMSIKKETNKEVK